MSAREYSDVTVVPYSELLHIPAGGSFHRGGPIWPDWENAGFARHWVEHRPADLEPVPARATTTVEREHLYWAGAVCWHFGHQIMDFSMRLIPSRMIDPQAAFVFASLPTLGAPPKWFHDLLSWFDIGPSDMLLLDRPTRFARLRVTAQAERREKFGPSPDFLDHMDAFVRSKQLRPPRTRKPIFVSRARQQIHFAGERYLEEAIRSAGGIVFRPEEHSIRTQIETYLGADRLLFSEGSALHVTSLAGRGFPEIDIILRRSGRRIGKQSVAPRAAELRYVDVIKGTICGLKRPGDKWDTRGIPVFDTPRLIAYLESAGLPVSKVWDSARYEHEVADDLRAWMRFELVPSRFEVEGYGDKVRETLEHTLAGASPSLIRELRDLLQAQEANARPGRIAGAAGPSFAHRAPGETLLRLRPASEATRAEGIDKWRAERGPIRFAVEAGVGGFPEGWMLLTGVISPAILDGSANLTLSTPRGDHLFEVPVSPAGRIFELIRFPRGVERVAWQPSWRAGSFEHSPLVMRKVGVLERLWLMTRRVAYMNWTRPPAHKERVGLSWWKPLWDLQAQYRASGRLRSYARAMPYEEWIEKFDRLSERDRRRIARRIAKLRVRFAVFVTGRDEATGRSLDAQLYRDYRVLEPGAGFGDDEYVCVLRAGDRLAEHALYWAAEGIAAGANVVYADEDAIDETGKRSSPSFKPDWSPEHLRSINYIGRWVVVRGAELLRAGGLTPEALAGDGHALHMRLADMEGLNVAHLPGALYHRSSSYPPPAPAPRRRYPLPQRPLVTIVVPTRDAQELLRKCLESVERETSYDRYEVVVVDHRSADPVALRYLAGLRHRVLRYEGEFNYAAINNRAVREARGEVIVLLNNDTEVISADWLEEMLGHLHRDGVGVVGAKLLYADGTVQHAGTAVGPGGCADHLHVGLPADAPGYCYRAVVAQEVSAVTGACLMTWRSLYERLQGLDEGYPVAFNDVDYCLRAQEAGYRVIFTPHAQLYHHESASRGRDLSEAQRARAEREARAVRRRWRARLEHDPYYNPNLSYRQPDFSLSDAPRARKPWNRALF